MTDPNREAAERLLTKLHFAHAAKDQDAEIDAILAAFREQRAQEREESKRIVRGVNDETGGEMEDAEVICARIDQDAARRAEGGE